MGVCVVSPFVLCLVQCFYMFMFSTMMNLIMILSCFLLLVINELTYLDWALKLNGMAGHEFKNQSY